MAIAYLLLEIAGILAGEGTNIVMVEADVASRPPAHLTIH
jgi:hypothetical protein